jgi:hypothetical protein
MVFSSERFQTTQTVYLAIGFHNRGSKLELQVEKNKNAPTRQI